MLIYHTDTPIEMRAPLQEAPLLWLLPINRKRQLMHQRVYNPKRQELREHPQSHSSRSVVKTRKESISLELYY